MPGQLIYTWKQTNDTLLISVAIPDDIDQTKLDITLTDLFVKVTYASQKLQIDLIHEIDPFQSTYSIDVPGKNVNLTLLKASPFSWHKLLWKGFPDEVKRRREHSMNRYVWRQEYLHQQRVSETSNQQHSLTNQILTDDQDLEEVQHADSPNEDENSVQHSEDTVHNDDQHTEDIHEEEASHEQDNNSTQTKSKKKKKKKKKKNTAQLKEEEKAEIEKERISEEEKHVEPSTHNQHQIEHSKHILLPPPLPAVSPLKSALRQPVSRHQKEKQKWNQLYNGGSGARHVQFDDTKNLTVDFGKYDTISILTSHLQHLKPQENQIFPDPDAHLFKDPSPSPPPELVNFQPKPPIEAISPIDNNNTIKEPPDTVSEVFKEDTAIMQTSEAPQKVPEETSGDTGAPAPKKRKKNKKKKDKQSQQPQEIQPEPSVPVTAEPLPQQKSKNKQPKLENGKHKEGTLISTADDMKLKANEAFNKGDYKSAIQLFTDAIAISNSKQIVPNLLNRALCHLTLLQHEQCIADTTAALKLLHCSPSIPSNLDLYTKTLAAKALVRRGAALCWSARAVDAEKDFEKALQLVPDDNEIRDDLYSIQEAVKQHVMQLKQEGDKFFKQQQYQAALMMYTRCVNILPTDARLFLNRALCYYNTMQFADCVSDCNRSLEILTDPNTPQDPQYVTLLAKCFVRRGSAYLRMHDLQNAAKDYQNALRMEPNNGDLKEDLKRIYGLIKMSN